VERARVLAAEVVKRPWPELEAGLKALLADHVLPDLEAEPGAADGLPGDFLRQLQALCIHTGAGYGTRSSAIVALAPGQVGHYLATEAAPCQGPWRDVTGLLAPGASAATG
jgi:hypothetical protein